MIFNAIKTREVTVEGGLARLLRTQFDENRPMGNIAQSELNEVVEAWLIGLNTEASPVIPRLVDWLDWAIERDEDFGTSRNFHRMILHWGKALALWMRDGVNAAAVWNQARLFDEAALTDGDAFTKNRIPTYRLDDYMAFCYQAEQYEAGIAEFEKFHGAKAVSLKRTLTPRDLAYALCLHKARGQFEKLALLEAGRKMLRSKLEDDWLGYGQANRAATWLKIVHWHHDPTLTPIQTILKAFDDMPNVPRPSFV